MSEVRNLDVEQTVRRARGGDRDALSALCEEFYPQLHRFFIGLLHATQDADDLAQATLLQMMEKLDTYRAFPGSKFNSWLFRIAYNKFIDQTRKKRPDVLDNYDPPDLSPPMVEGMIQEEQTAQLWQALTQIDDELRAMIAMRYQLDMPYADIAKALGIQTGRVKWRLHEGLEKLKGIMTKEGLA